MQFLKMQNLPSKNTINKFCTVIRNYCTPCKLTYCDPVEDYNILKENKVSEYLILNCLQAIIFVIETKVIYPRYQKELLLLKEEDKKFDPSFIIENTNILDFNEYCKRSKSPNIDTNDLNTKINAARKFLSKGDKVKVTLRFRGREMAHMQNSKHILVEFGEALNDVAVVEKEPKVEGRSMTMFLAEKR